METSDTSARSLQAANSQHASSYAFLNHSSTTLPNNLPPSVDNKPLARQKRRRTSPEDQAILEAAYHRDFKPDKAARLELVKQVALGEKEVQIWFQNRRQTSRRKSRPLLPHEIAQYHMSRGAVLDQSLAFEPSSDPASDDEPAPSALTANGPHHRLNDDELRPSTAIDQSKLSEPTLSSPVSTDASSNASDPSAYPKASSQDFSQDQRPTLPSISHITGDYFEHTPSAALETSRSFRRHSSIPSNSEQDNTKRSELKRSSSILHLSFTSEGNATLATKDGTSPSPPRASQISVEMLCAPASTDPVVNEAALPPIKNLQRSSSGRSRDSRTWEFWCDKDARGELEVKAERDASGSAADAIGLLRAASHRRALVPLSSKPLNSVSKTSSNSQLNRFGSKIGSLQRSSTALGRLQNTSTNVIGRRPSTLAPIEQKGLETAKSMYIPGNDSDKENWSPRTESTASDRRPSVYGDLPRDFDGLGRKRLVRPEAELEADPEVAAFMRRGREDDLDCIQGLLSLSQGNWR